jgi:hypothetical protein
LINCFFFSLKYRIEDYIYSNLFIFSTNYTNKNHAAEKIYVGSGMLASMLLIHAQGHGLRMAAACPFLLLGANYLLHAFTNDLINERSKLQLLLSLII